MGITKHIGFEDQKGVEGLPLFNVALRGPGVIERNEFTPDIGPVCERCGTHSNCDCICEDCGKVIDGVQANVVEIQNTLSEVSNVDLTAKYMCEGEEFGNVKFIGVEDHDFFRVAIVEISHKFPGKEYLHKGNKRNPVTGKYDGEPVVIKKMSPGSIKRQKYRIQYDATHILEGNYGVFCFSGEKRDGKEVNLNLNSIKLILKEIEEMLAE